MTPPIEAGQIVADVLTRWPQTIPVFTAHQMACVGCPIAPFETLAEVAAIYHLNLRNFLDELNCVIEESIAQIPAI
jgi:hybrid cluster-associated redox disulfide protein